MAALFWNLLPWTSVMTKVPTAPPCFLPRPLKPTWPRTSSPDASYYLYCVSPSWPQLMQPTSTQPNPQPHFQPHPPNLCRMSTRNSTGKVGLTIFIEHRGNHQTDKRENHQTNN